MSWSPNTALLSPLNGPDATIPGISQAMVIERGRLMILSGHVPIDANGHTPGGDLAAQLELVFSNIQRTLQIASADMSCVARLTLYVRDYQPRQLPTIRAVRDRWIDHTAPPASALIGVASLFREDILVEVDAWAVLPPLDAPVG